MFRRRSDRLRLALYALGLLILAVLVLVMRW